MRSWWGLKKRGRVCSISWGRMGRTESVGSAFVFLLCTDGVSAYLDEAAIAACLSADAPAAAIADSLVEVAVARGSTDDATVIVVRPDTWVGHPIRAMGRLRDNDCKMESTTSDDVRLRIV